MAVDIGRCPLAPEASSRRARLNAVGPSPSLIAGAAALCALSGSSPANVLSRLLRRGEDFNVVRRHPGRISSRCPTRERDRPVAAPRAARSPARASPPPRLGHCSPDAARRDRRPSTSSPRPVPAGACCVRNAQCAAPLARWAAGHRRRSAGSNRLVPSRMDASERARDLAAEEQRATLATLHRGPPRARRSELLPPVHVPLRPMPLGLLSRYAARAHAGAPLLQTRAFGIDAVRPAGTGPRRVLDARDAGSPDADVADPTPLDWSPRFSLRGPPRANPTRMLLLGSGPSILLPFDRFAPGLPVAVSRRVPNARDDAPPIRSAGTGAPWTGSTGPLAGPAAFSPLRVRSPEGRRWDRRRSGGSRRLFPRPGGRERNARDAASRGPFGPTPFYRVEPACSFAVRRRARYARSQSADLPRQPLVRARSRPVRFGLRAPWST